MKPTAEARHLLHEGSLALSRVEQNGIRIDLDYLKRARRQLVKKTEQKIENLKDTDIYQRWKKKYGSQFNFEARPQLGSILGEMGLGSGEKTKTGKIKTTEEALSQIDHPFVEEYITIQKMLKAENTFLAGIERETADDGFLRPFFHLHLVTTYRSSSDSINFQNLPVRDPRMAKLIRQCFIPRDGHVLVEIDYSGIEVRVAACYHKDPSMIEYINDPSKDMHRDMAARCFKMKPEEVSKTARYCGKNMFVFPQFYGDYYANNARQLWDAISKLKLETKDGVHLFAHLAERGISNYQSFEDHIKKQEHHFWTRMFADYAQWKDDWWQAYLKTGEFETLTGFVLRGLFNRNDVINYPVQGSAFHCLLFALIMIVKRIDKRKMRTKIVGQIHDSIVADVPIDEFDDYIGMASEIMSKLVPRHWKWIIVPLEVEIEACPESSSWYEKKEVQL